MIRMIVALDRSRGIAKHGYQPWNIPDDEQYFQRQTLEHGATVIMGRKTFDVIRHPLPDRTNVVVTRQTDLQHTDVTVVHDLGAYLREADHDVWVIGGAAIYDQAMPYADELFITTIDADFGCDTFFPDWQDNFVYADDPEDWREQNGFRYRFTRWRRK